LHIRISTPKILTKISCQKICIIHFFFFNFAISQDKAAMNCSFCHIEKQKQHYTLRRMFFA